LGTVGTDSSESTTSGSGAPLLSKNQDPTILGALHVARRGGGGYLASKGM
jgi:hypothetical protein